MASIPEYEMCPGPLTYDEDGNMYEFALVEFSNSTEIVNGSTKQSNLSEPDNTLLFPTSGDPGHGLAVPRNQLGELSLPCP